MDLKEKLLLEFSEFEKSLNGQRSTIIHSIRKNAIKVFGDLGFPTRKNEEWRYTHLNNVIAKEYSNIKISSENKVTKAELEKYLIPELEANLLVTINGRYSNELSSIREKNKNILLCGFKYALEKYPEIIENVFSKTADYNTDSIIALNTAFASDGFFVHVPENTEPKYPVLMINITVQDNSNIFVQPRNCISAGKNSGLNLIEINYSIGQEEAFTNAVTEISIGENSSVIHYKVQNENENSFNISNLHINQLSKSRFESFIVSWGGKIIRNNTNSYLTGRNAECHLNGIYISHNKQLIDNHTLVDHSVPDCFSNEFYKGILDDEGIAVFNGKVLVRKDAQKTNAYQSNKNIVLSDLAVINAKPQLEIFADDVKCSHGATTGQINEEELFYLKSRGIAEEDAKRLLLFAFLSELILEVKSEPLKGYLENMLNKKLNKEF